MKTLCLSIGIMQNVSTILDCASACFALIAHARFSELKLHWESSMFASIGARDARFGCLLDCVQLRTIQRCLFEYCKISALNLVKLCEN